MTEIWIIILLYVVALVLLTADIFLPTHGILTVAGVGFLVAAVVRTFQYGGQDAGVVSVIGCLVFLPAFAYVAVRYWHRTPIGRRISPPNPTLTAQDMGVPLEEMTRLVGATGRAISPLRPVGICDFNGRRVSCIVEHGSSDSGAAVRVRGLSGGIPMVVEQRESA